MNKYLKAILPLALMGVLFVGCAEEETTETAESTTEGETEGGTIRMFNNKVEIEDALQAYAAQYEEATGVKVEITTGSDYTASLKAEAAAGTMPDIFIIEGKSTYETWKDHMVPLTDEEWVQYTDYAYYGEDGEVYGFPVSIEAIGMIYNADLLAQAGVDPATLNCYDGYKAAFETINAQKEELGINAVVAMATGAEMYWTAGHNLNAYLANGVERGDTTYLDMTLNGEVDEQRMSEYADWVELLYQYSDPDIMVTGNYDDQVNAFINQEVVFIHQGNWIDPNLVAANVTFEVGIAPVGSTYAPVDSIMTSTPSWYCVSKSTPEQEQLAKDFLNSIAMTPEGHDYMVNQAQMVPAFSNVTLKPTAPISAAVAEYDPAQTYPWYMSDLPAEYLNSIGPIYNQYAAGEITKEEFIQMMTDAIALIPTY